VKEAPVLDDVTHASDHDTPGIAPFRRPSASGDANARLYTSPAYFDAEMAVLAGTAWQFVATTSELSSANDWVRAHVFGADVFVQNVRGELRGFRNICQHRGFPLRRQPSGNGPIVCGFHAWRYDGEGVPVGVVRNAELFGLLPEERADMALPRVRVDTIGTMVFVALDDAVPPLDQYLGRFATLLRAATSRMGACRHRWSGETKANWKLCYEVTLDDYHVQFVHPESIGKTAIPAWGFLYEREGPHSHMLRRRTADWTFPGFWDNLDRNEYEYAGYKIHHLFPTTFLVATREALLISSFSPLAPGRTAMDDRVFELTNNPLDDAFWEEAARNQRQVSDEDRRISEAQQEVIADFARPATFGALEQRVAWFHEAYEALVGAHAREAVAGQD
jgi:choline monooxygenase